MPNSSAFYGKIGLRTLFQDQQEYINRIIVHPNFKNITYAECEKLLADAEQGSVLIRPSRKGTQFLTLTWKVDQSNNILSHDEILEEEKANQFSLGKKLRINDEEFEDLDEIIARYVEPMAKNARDVISFKYYKSSTTTETMNTLLRNDKALTPNRIPYYITASSKRPGRFMLSYMPGSMPRHEPIGVSHIGFRYRGKIHNTFPGLVRWFKEHWRDAPPLRPSKAASTFGGKSAVTDYTADFTDVTEPFQTPRSGAFSDTASVYSSGRTPSHKTPILTPGVTPTNYTSRSTPGATPGNRSGSRTPAGHTPGGRTPGSTTPVNLPPPGARTPGDKTPMGPPAPGSRTPGNRTPGYPGNRTPGQHVPRGARTPGQQGSGGSRTPGQHTSNGTRTPGNQTPGSARTPGQHGSGGGRTPGQHGSSGGARTPGHHTPSSHGNRTPSQMNPGSRTPGQRTPHRDQYHQGSSRSPAHHASPHQSSRSPHPLLKSPHHQMRSPHQRSPHHPMKSMNSNPAKSSQQQYPSPARPGSRTPMSLMESPKQVSPRPTTPVA